LLQLIGSACCTLSGNHCCGFVRKSYPEILVVHPEILVAVHPEILMATHPEILVAVHPEILAGTHPEILVTVHPEILVAVDPAARWAAGSDSEKSMGFAAFCEMLHPDSSGNPCWGSSGCPLGGWMKVRNKT
jgi:hypothetical protein